MFKFCRAQCRVHNLLQGGVNKSKIEKNLQEEIKLNARYAVGVISPSMKSYRTEATRRHQVAGDSPNLLKPKAELSSENYESEDIKLC
ncbi:hypothetical protein AKJ44_01270 [candidate division MSBL1 archaeon SCGC-AAA261F17]|uniref:Uncharacterized protein n=1 Tax=candidate division MSBL1 archaeon SCGC-AAA261F17 TaxID=1698274 RepID=A0A133V6T4_9EURY|nr:hypothetical protein AKJ44_01270 [candidate division MSBL1 archaeon SCGC-AAA261F17]